MSIRKTETALARQATRYIQVEHVDRALAEFAKHLEKTGTDDPAPNAFFEQWAKENPDAARPAPPPAPPQKAPSGPTFRSRSITPEQVEKALAGDAKSSGAQPSPLKAAQQQAAGTELRRRGIY